MKNILETGDKKDCNGCRLCEVNCPVNAITMQEDEAGFIYPNINEDICIHCNKCIKICSQIVVKKNTYETKVYGTYTKNEEELSQSASGGMYYVLAKYVIAQNGVVFGVKYDENLVVKHDYATTLEDCKVFRGSKYARSDINHSYEKVKQFLKEGRYVLFTGTPCQCNALRLYLNKENEKLILCDIVCHSNPSPKILKKYIEELEESRNKKIKDIIFRDKRTGWRNSIPVIVYEDGTLEEENTYFKAFIRELLNMPACNNCSFASENRVTDITIGDLWGIEKMLQETNGDKGTSLFSINSKNGEKIFEEIKDKIHYKEVDKKIAIKYNHYRNVPINKKRQLFYHKVSQGGSVIYYMNKYSKLKLNERIKKGIKKTVKKMIKRR